MTINYQACLNVLAGLNAKGRTRLEEATEFARRQLDAGDDRPTLDLPRIAKPPDSYWAVDCQECGEWDGADRRCCCGNRRVAWSWDDTAGRWEPEVY